MKRMKGWVEAMTIRFKKRPQKTCHASRWLCARQRRHRKSELIKKLRPTSEAMGYTVTCVAFTHVAVANID